MPSNFNTYIKRINLFLCAFILLEILEQYLIRCVYSLNIYSSDEIYLSDYMQGDQSGLVFAALNGGSLFVAVWECYLCDLSGYGIFAKIYKADGSNLTNEFQVNSYTTGHQLEPSIDSINNQTNFVVSWSSFGQDGSEFGIFFKIFDLKGNNLTNDIRANTFIQSNQSESKIVSLAPEGTKYAIIWLSYGQKGNFLSIVMKIFNSSGLNTTDDLIVSSFKTNSNFVFTKLDRDSKIAIAFAGDLQNGYFWDIFFSKFDSNGMTICREIQANSITVGDQINPTIQTFGDQQNFILAWQTKSNYEVGFGIIGKVINSNCDTPSGYRTNVFADLDQTDPTIIALENNLLVILWRTQNSNGNELDIRGRTIDGSYSFITNEYQINQKVENIQSNQKIISILNGSYFLAIWDTQFTNSTYSNISMRIANPLMTIRSNEIIINKKFGEQSSPIGLAPGNGTSFIIGWLGKEQNITQVKSRIFSSCQTSDECCLFKICIARPTCSNYACQASLFGNFTVNSSEIISTESLNLSANSNATYLLNPISYKFSCFILSSNSLISCTDPLSIFNRSSTNSSLIIPPNYFQPNLDSLYRFDVLVSNAFSNFSKSLNVTIRNKSAFIESICTASTKTTCKACLSNCSTISNCRSQVNSCPECYSDSNCNRSFPVCISQVCYKNEIQANIFTQSSISYKDQDLNLTSIITTNPQYLNMTYKWTCEYLNGTLWKTCFDNIANNFTVTLNLPELFIPSLYFSSISSNETEFRFTLNVSTDYNYSFCTKNIKIYNRTYITIEPYPYYFSSQEYNITINHFVQENFTYTYSFETYPEIPFTQSSNKFLLARNSFNFDAFSALNIRINISFSSRMIPEYLLIPINKAPVNGSLEISPSIGIANVTSYTFSAVYWTDSDIPLGYRFSYSYNSADGFTNFFDAFSSYSVLETYLKGNSSSNKTMIQDEVSDSYGVKATHQNITICQTFSKDIASSINILSDTLASLNNSNMNSTQMTQTLNLISNQIVELELNLQNGTNSLELKLKACPSCSGHGFCQSEICKCDLGWSFYDCSMSSQQFYKIIETKMKIIDSVAQLLGDPANKNNSKLTSTLMMVTSNPDFN